MDIEETKSMREGCIQLGYEKVAEMIENGDLDGAKKCTDIVKSMEDTKVKEYEACANYDVNLQKTANEKEEKEKERELKVEQAKKDEKKWYLDKVFLAGTTVFTSLVSAGVTTAVLHFEKTGSICSFVGRSILPKFLSFGKK